MRKQLIKVAHLNYALNGGAGAVAQTLCAEVDKTYFDSKIFTIVENSILEKGIRDPLHFISGAIDRLLVSKTSISFNLLKKSFNSKLITELKRFNPDIIHFHGVHGMFNEEKFISSFNRVPVVWTLHDMTPFTGGCTFSGSCTNYISKCIKCPQANLVFKGKISASQNKKIDFSNQLNLKKVIAPSRWIYDAALKSRVLQNKSLTLIENPIHFSSLPVHPSDSSFLKGLSKNKINVIIMSFNLNDRRKGNVELLNQLDRLASSYPWLLDFKFILVGKGSVPKLKRLDHELIGFISVEDEKNALLQHADIIISNSYGDNAPLTVLQAIRNGCLPILRKGSGHDELVNNAIDGYLYNDYDDLVKFLFEIRNDRDRLKKFNKTVLSNLMLQDSFRNNILSYENAYKEVLSFE